MMMRRSIKQNKARSGLGSGLTVLEFLAANDQGITLTEMALALAMSKSNVHSVLRILLARNYVTRSDDGVFRLGIAAWQIGAAAPQAEVGSVAEPAMNELVRSVSEGAILGMLDGFDVVYTKLVESSQAVRVHAQLGDRIPAHCTSTGLALLAGLSDDDVKAIMPARLEKVTPETIATAGLLLQEIQKVRVRGVAVNCGGWREDVAGIALGVHDKRGMVVAALCVAAPRHRVNKAWIGRVSVALSKAVAQIEQDLGGSKQGAPYRRAR